MNSKAAVGVLLMTYGSPGTLDDVLSYMTNVYGGRTPDAQLVQDFRRRYDLIGGSPLVPITLAQAAGRHSRRFVPLRLPRCLNRWVRRPGYKRQKNLVAFRCSAMSRLSQKGSAESIAWRVVDRSSRAAGASVTRYLSSRIWTTVWPMIWRF